MRKIISLLIAICMVFSFSCVFGDEISDNTLMNIVFTVDSDTAYVNGQVYELPAAVFRDEVSGNIMVPLESFCDIYGIQVKQCTDMANLYALTKNGLESKLYIIDDPEGEKVTFTPRDVYDSQGEGIVESLPDSLNYGDEYLVELYGINTNDVQYIAFELFAKWLGFNVALNDDGTVELNELRDDEIFEYSAEACYEDGVLTVTRGIKNHTPFYIIGYAPDPCEFTASLYKDVGGEERLVCNIAGYGEYPAVVVATSVKPNSEKIHEYTVVGSDTDSDTGALSSLDKGSYICRMNSRVKYVFAGFRTVEKSEKTYAFTVDGNCPRIYDAYIQDGNTVVTTFEISNSVLCAADYDKNGALVNFKTFEYSYPANAVYDIHTVVFEDIKADKVFMLDSLETMEPLCDAATVKTEY